MQICLDNRQGSLLPPREACISLLKPPIAYLGTDTQVSPAAARSQCHNTNLHEPLDFPSHMEACQDPTRQHGAASDRSTLPSAATSSQGLLQQLGLARVHKWFKNPSRLASAMSQACSPCERQSRGELGARLLQLGSAKEFPPASVVQRQWMQARGLAQKLFILDSGSPCALRFR